MCGKRTRAAAPAGVDAPVQYGPRIAAIVMYLYVGQFLSKKRTAQALAKLFGTPVSEGTVASMSKRAADHLSGFLDQLTDRLSQAEVAGFDETGLRVAGKLHWVHCARTDKYTLITCHPKRGKKGIDDAALSGTGIFQILIATTSWVGLTVVVAGFGSLAVAGYGIATRIVMFALMPSFGMANAAATLVGQNLGAGRPERAEQAVWRASFYNLVFLGVAGVLREPHTTVEGRVYRALRKLREALA